MKTKYILVGVLIAFVSFATSASAAKLFAIDASYVDGSTPVTIRVENSSFPDLVGDLFHGQGGFSALRGQDVFGATIQFFGVRDALLLSTQKTTGGLFEVVISSGLVDGLNKTIIAVDKDDLRKQLVDWIYLDAGADALLLLEAVALVSTAAISDGTPGATTAQMADSAFGLFGFYPRTSAERNQRGFESGALFGLNVEARSFAITTPVGDMQGDRLDLQVPLWLHFNSRVSYAGQININRTTIEGTDFYGFGADLGLVFRPVLRIGDDIFGWSLTPFVGGKAMGSVDGVTAAILYDYGINNRFEWRLMQRGLVSWVFQLSKYDNLQVSIDEYNLNAEVNQAIMKNGVMLRLPVFSLSALNANFFLIDTRFLEEANISNYQTVGFGLGYNGDSFSVQTSMGFDYAGDYQGIQLDLGCSWDL